MNFYNKKASYLRTLCSGNLTLFLWGFWKDLKNLISYTGNLCILELHIWDMLCYSDHTAF
jgi:hypothetical protein